MCGLRDGKTTPYRALFARYFTNSHKIKAKALASAFVKSKAMHDFKSPRTKTRHTYWPSFAYWPIKAKSLVLSQWCI